MGLIRFIIISSLCFWLFQKLKDKESILNIPIIGKIVNKYQSNVVIIIFLLFSNLLF